VTGAVRARIQSGRMSQGIDRHDADVASGENDAGGAGEAITSS
jgi:hypothetical protein